MPDPAPDAVEQKPETAERAHHPDSPSSLQSSEACPLFQNEQRDSRASISGTLCHKATELEDLSLCETEEQAEAVRKCLDYAQRLGETKYADAGDVTVYKELALSVGTEKVGEFTGVTSGFPDLIYVAGASADLVDWKFGAEPVVPTKDNLQGIAYALALFEKLSQVQDITVHFFAPNQHWGEQEHNEKYVHTFHRADVPSLELRLRTVIARKHAAVVRLDRSRNTDWRDALPRDGLCLWCARKGDCKKLHSSIIRTSEKYPDFVAPVVVDPLLLTRTEEVALAFRWSNQVEYIAKAIKNRCTQMALTENLDLGDSLKIVKREERQIKDIKKLMEVAVQNGVTQDELMSIVSVPFTKVEEFVKKKAPKGKGAAAVRALQCDWEFNGAVELGVPVYFLKEIKSPKDKQTNTLTIEA